MIILEFSKPRLCWRLPFCCFGVAIKAAFRHRAVAAINNLIQSAGEDSYVNSSRKHTQQRPSILPYISKLPSSSRGWPTAPAFHFRRAHHISGCLPVSFACFVNLKVGEAAHVGSGSDARPSLNRCLETSTGAEHEPPNRAFHGRSTRWLVEKSIVRVDAVHRILSTCFRPPPPPMSGHYCSPHHHCGAEKSNQPVFYPWRRTSTTNMMAARCHAKWKLARISTPPIKDSARISKHTLPMSLIVVSAEGWVGCYVGIRVSALTSDGERAITLLCFSLLAIHSFTTKCLIRGANIFMSNPFFMNESVI